MVHLTDSILFVATTTMLFLYCLRLVSREMCDVGGERSGMLLRRLPNRCAHHSSNETHYEIQVSLYDNDRLLTWVRWQFSAYYLET